MLNFVVFLTVYSLHAYIQTVREERQLHLLLFCGTQLHASKGRKGGREAGEMQEKRKVEVCRWRCCNVEWLERVAYASSSM